MTHAAPTPDAPDDDPWLWLEEVEGERATAWADAQTAATLAKFGGPSYAADRDVLRTLLDRPDNLPVPARRGGLLYNFWRDGLHPRGVWRRTTLESYRSDAPGWDLLLDLDAVATAEGEDWVWQGASTLPPAHDRAVIRLSRGGSDAVVLREFDLQSRGFVADGFNLAEAKGGVAWIDRDTLLLSSAAFGATQSGYASTARLWRRGQPPGPPLFETGPANMSAWGDYDSATGWLVFGEATDFFNFNFFIGDLSGPKHRVELPSDASFVWDRRWLAIKLRTPWTVGDTQYRADTLLVIDRDAFLAGDRAFKVLFEPSPRVALQNFGWVGGMLLVGILDELRPVIQLVHPGDWTTHVLDGMPPVGTAGAWAFDIEDTESDGTLLASVQDPLTPPTLMMVPPVAGRACHPQAEPGGVRFRGPGGHAARGDLHRRRAHPLRTGGAAGRNRGGAGTHDRLWRVRRVVPSGLRHPHRQALAGTGVARRCSRISVAGGSSAPAGTRPGGGRASACRTTISRRSRTTWCGAASPGRGASRRKAAPTAGC